MGIYTPPEPINGSSENEHRGANRGEEIKRGRQSKREKNMRGNKILRELTRLTFSYFSEAPYNCFSKSKVLIFQDLPFSGNLWNQTRKNS